MSDKKAGLGIGLAGIFLGMMMMLTGTNICRTSCWMDNMVRLFLPQAYESAAGGLVVLLVGAVIVMITLKGGRGNTDKPR